MLFWCPTNSTDRQAQVYPLFATFKGNTPTLFGTINLHRTRKSSSALIEAKIYNNIIHMIKAGTNAEWSPPLMKYKQQRNRIRYLSDITPALLAMTTEQCPTRVDSRFEIQRIDDIPALSQAHCREVYRDLQNFLYW